MDDIETIHADILDRIVTREDLRPMKVDVLSSMHTGQRVGEFSELLGFNIDKAVAVELRLDDEGDGAMDLRWLYVFSPSMSLTPHLAIEWATTGHDDGAQVELLVDLLPRIDLAVNLEYVDEIYHPLTSLHGRVPDIDGARFKYVPPRRAVAMSPWRMSVSAPESSTHELESVVDGYVDRWISIISGGVAADIDPLARDTSRLVQHDRFHRNAVFDEESNPIWSRISRFVGLDAAAELRMTLRSQRER